MDAVFIERAVVYEDNVSHGNLKHPVVRHLWLIYVTQTLATILALNMLVGMFFYRTSPWTYMYTITTVECLALIICVQVLPWTLD
jgi:membrane protein YdbS with pleckstrin-like domain